MKTGCQKYYVNFQEKKKPKPRRNLSVQRTVRRNKM